MANNHRDTFVIINGYNSNNEIKIELDQENGDPVALRCIG